jgi:transposase-like protein
VCHHIENKSRDKKIKIDLKREVIMPSHAENRRRQAITRYLDGDKIDDICEQMNCSKSWLYKWRNRYQPDDPAWAQPQSRRPRTQAVQTPEHLEQAVIQLRQTLGQSGQPGGAVAIQQALRQQGLEPIPSPRTIYRILERHSKKENTTH